MTPDYGREMRAVIKLLGQEPVSCVQGDQMTLYTFADGMEVIETNAYTVSELDDGFAELRAGFDQ